MNLKGIILVCLIVVSLGLCISRAEMWPELDEYVNDCDLIVRAKTMSKIAGKDHLNDKFSFRVLETWVGNYDPKDFRHTSPQGYIFARDGEHGVNNVKIGQEIIFFFTQNNQPTFANGKFESHTTAFPVTKGKIVYAATNPNMRREYTLIEFKQKIQKSAAKRK